MKIIVCVKQVPNTKQIRIDPETGTMIRKGVPSIINPDDKNALEYALSLKDQDASNEIIVLSMGPLQAKEVLLECLSMGADRAILLSDRFFGGGDTWATSNTLAKAIEKEGTVDLIICGHQAIDGDTAQVGPQIAARLDIPQITYVCKSEIKADGTIIAEREMEDGRTIVKSQLPILLTTTKNLNTPRYMNIGAIVKVTANAEKLVTIWNFEDLGLTRQQTGLKGSPTRVKKSFSPPHSAEINILEGTLEETTQTLAHALKDLNLL